MRPNSLAIMEKKGNFRQEGVQNMTFFQKLAWKLQQFMTGRRGADPLCMATMILGLILTLLGQIVNGVVGVILILLSSCFPQYGPIAPQPTICSASQTT